MNAHYLTGQVNTIVGTIPQISTVWSGQDLWNTIKVRWSVGRMDYKVEPGIYAVGNPGESSLVFVTANFKLTFDHVRRALGGMDAWLLVLDTKGINVWCAAGKGTFSTKELVRQINLVGLEKIVNHHKVIVPQLGAVGVSAHEIRKNTGFSVIYGPVRAEDILDFVEAGMKATKEMRAVKFSTWDRLKLIPVEMGNGRKYLLLIPAIFLILSGLNPKGYSIDMAYHDGLRSVFNLLIAYVTGCGITPALLPWIPFRRFALKGLLTGWLAAFILAYFHFLGKTNFEIISWFLMIGSLSSFLAMTFTGTSTFTSLSGVQKEMKTAVPMQIGMAGLGVIAWIVSKFITL
ncbi:MAG TPA: mercury methylation corrinoid protein HgcA [Bacteroidales bacterium]|nr:mercury methylation corrinoid protein HgcA [Bacteroidales bacterium]